MRKHTYFATGLALALGLLVPAAPVSAQTAAQPVVTNYETEMAQIVPAQSAGVYAGTLRLSVSQSGIVQGYYQTQDGLVEPVTGGKNGDAIWFSIGESGTVRVTGNMYGSSIVGSAQDATSSNTLSFTAKLTQQ